MKFPDRMALDRALTMLPACPERERVIEALLDDGGEYGFFPRHQDIKTVGDMRTSPRLRDICPDTYIWLFTELDRPELTPHPAIEDGARAHAANEFDDPAQLLPILDQIVQEGGNSHASFGDRLARLDLPYREMIRFQDAVAKIVIDANHYDKVGALLREPDVKMVRAKVQLAIQGFSRVDPQEQPPLTIAEIASLPSHHGVPIRTTSGDLYKQSFDNILPPEPPTTVQIVDEIRAIIRDAGTSAAEDWDEAKDIAAPAAKPARKAKPSKPKASVPAVKGALADVLKDI